MTDSQEGLYFLQVTSVFYGAGDTGLPKEVTTVAKKESRKTGKKAAVPKPEKETKPEK